MDNKTLQRILQKLSPSRDEKEAMREHIHEYVQMNPVRDQEAAADTSTSFFARYFQFRYAVAPLLLFLLLASGVAAERALPGDILYPFKTGVNEQVMRALAFSPESEARVETFLMKRRLEEVEDLTVQNNLSTEVRAQVTRRIQVHASSTRKEIGEVAGDASGEIANEFRTALAVHSEVLTQLAQGSTTVEAHVSEIVKSAGTAVATSTADLSRRTNPSTATVSRDERGTTTQRADREDARIESHLQIREKEMERRLQHIEELLSQYDSELSQQEKRSLKARLADIQTSFETAVQSRKDGDFTTARRRLSATLSDINKIRELISVAIRLNASGIIDAVFRDARISDEAEARVGNSPGSGRQEERRQERPDRDNQQDEREELRDSIRQDTQRNRNVSTTTSATTSATTSVEIQAEISQ